MSSPLQIRHLRYGVCSVPAISHLFITSSHVLLYHIFAILFPNMLPNSMAMEASTVAPRYLGTSSDQKSMKQLGRLQELRVRVMSLNF